MKVLKIELPHDPAILLYIYTHTKELKEEYQRDICILTFIAELFTIANS